MAHSLLAHMYSHIRGSQEDIATYSIEFIVSQSYEVNEAYTKLLETSLHTSLGSSLRYSCQATGKNKERPDLSGVNVEGNEIVLCEAKFYAGLTSNQPNAYIDRLVDEHGKGLVFICPAERKVLLWDRLKTLCCKRKVELVDEYCVSVDGIRMSIITWGEVLDALRRSAASISAASILSDIDQLEGFCQLMADDAFIPFTSEDLGPENARREERNYQVPDAVVKRLMTDKSIDAEVGRLKASPNRQGYIRYIYVSGHGVAIIFDRAIWKSTNTEETPFWVSVMEKNFRQTPVYQSAFNRYPQSYRALASNNNGIALPLFPPINASLDEVAEDLVRQIMEYIKVIDEAIK